MKNKKPLQMANSLKKKGGGVSIVTSKEVMGSKQPIQSIQIDKIKSPKFHDRKHYSHESIIELAGNIQANKGGKLLQPIVVRELDNGEYERIIGFRRIEAYKYMGRKEIESIILSDITDEEALLIMLSENIQRENPNFYDQTVGIMDYIGVALNMEFDDVKKMLYHFRNIDSKTVKLSDEMAQKRSLLESITKKLGKISVSTMINRLKVFSLNELILSALRDGEISYNAAIEINRTKEIEKIKYLIEKVKNENLSIKGIKEYLALHKPKNTLTYDIKDDGNKTLLSIERLNPTKRKKLEEFLKKL